MGTVNEDGSYVSPGTLNTIGAVLPDGSYTGLGSVSLTQSFLLTELSKQTPIVHRNFTIGSSNYADRVLKWPTLKRDTTKTKPINLTIPLVNDDKALNYLLNSSALLNTDVTLQMGVLTDSGTEDNLDLFKGKIESAEASNGVLTIGLLDRFKSFTEALVGDTTSGGAIQFVDSDHLPGDLLWTMVTCYGGLSDVRSTSNPDIDYTSFVEWENIFIGDSILLNAKFTGEKVIDIIGKFSESLDSSFTFENNKLRFYRGSIQADSQFVDFGDEQIVQIKARLSDRDIINKKYVAAGWSVSSNYSTVNVFAVDSNSQVAFGLREDRLKDGAMWFTNSDSALNLAERYIFKQKNPLIRYTIDTGLRAATLLIADGVKFSDSQLDVLSSSEFYVEGLSINMDTGKTSITTRNMPQLQAFYLDVNTLSVLDQNYNFLL